ncbi:hypothetical protein [Mucilaginibacter sp. L3T2-6]|uniref:hypothetical protein n=1 Tax=Mucilaginibacter sp. L3T2-6 TaxID=3062491 RepID=UPI002675CBCF|nr:hypothetical protein [Mucilaginibacter sp. L3T2-6]MDO3640546.1 hypothetical protein [Mucilaginibacter sp. L3T2-6]MDV6213115.1 hypothetical protein [Mucilaginibacter sp. L3T2-6]
MSRSFKIKIIVPLAIVLFAGAYGHHKRVARETDITGKMENKLLDETSGIAASGIDPAIYYVHNDSGDTSRFFAITADGKLKSTLYFKGDKKAKQGVFDCEDIAVGPGPVKRKSYVYLGDIGDNDGKRPFITVYRFEENAGWLKNEVNNVDAVPLHLKYPDGPKDAETLMADPTDNLLYIVSKRQDSVTVYTAPLKYKANDTVTLTKRCKLFFAGLKLFKWITAGDISKDGSQVVLKSYEKVYYWKRNGNEPVWKTMQAKPQIPFYVPEKQGEAIGFTADGKGYYTTSEGVYAPIYYYKVP